MKHNKYKNVGVIYEALCTAVLKEVGEGNNKKAKMYMSLVKKYFMNESTLQKAWKVYNQLLYSEAVNYFYADRFLGYLVKEYNSIDKNSIDHCVKSLFEDVSSFSNKKNLMKTKTPNYRLFASFNILAEQDDITSSERITCERTLSEHLIDNKEATRIRDSKTVREVIPEQEEIDSETKQLADVLAINIFKERYNNKLNEDQKDLLVKYITSSNQRSFDKWMKNKSQKVIEEIDTFVTSNYSSVDTETREKLYLVSEKLKNLTSQRTIREQDLTTMLLSLQIKDYVTMFS